MPRHLMPLDDRGPLRVMFLLTSMPIGGAETLLVEIVRRLDRSRFLPEMCCLKRFDPLGEMLSKEIPSFTGLLRNKCDAGVLWRLKGLFQRRRTDALVTVGTGGDRMFWGRLAARWAGVPVVCSAIHSTGYPDRIEWCNRLLGPITDALIAVAEPHRRWLVRHGGVPAHKVRVIPNGVDIDRFHPRRPNPAILQELGIDPTAPVAGIVAALRPEKNHELFLQAAALVRRQLPAARFLVVGDGPRRAKLEALAAELGLAESVRFLGSRADIPELLSVISAVALTSHMEANPISILEAMAAERPVVATRVGSVDQTVLDGETGYLGPPGDAARVADRLVTLLGDRDRAENFGRAARRHVALHWSIERTVAGYQDLLAEIYPGKADSQPQGATIANRSKGEGQRAKGEGRRAKGEERPGPREGREPRGDYEVRSTE